ncbi:hypothetical protein CVT25_012956 [Psilocybe cyanescens]|uniref:Uncharacterized protein n=1 Tax=Psilocybe cyanescens TaxID=93625 RepID=A0A409XLG1_PSICY|nr:hypothetical protein CVT25_012956 [Psilocybe cyanescens]
MGKDKRNLKKCQLSTSASEGASPFKIRDSVKSSKKQKQMQISDPDDYMEVDNEDSNSGLQSNIRKPNPSVKPTYKQSGCPSKRDQKSRTDPILDDQNMAASQFLQPVTPPQKVNKKNTSMNQYTPWIAQTVQFSIQTSIWQIEVDEEPPHQPRHGATNSSEMRPLNGVI